MDKEMNFTILYIIVWVVLSLIFIEIDKHETRKMGLRGVLFVSGVSSIFVTILLHMIGTVVGEIGIMIVMPYLLTIAAFSAILYVLYEYRVNDRNVFKEWIKN